MSALTTLHQLAYELDEYEFLLRSLLDDGFRFVPFRPLSDDEVILRHDVDLDPTLAVEMARIEANLGISATYCFQLTTPVYSLLEVSHDAIVNEIIQLGHDVALHFNTHYYWDERPDIDDVTMQVRAECDVLASLVDRPIDVVSFHRPPNWVLDVDFDGFVNTYSPQFFSDVEYVSDSTQKWRFEPPFPDGRPDRLQLLVHPGLWREFARPMNDIVDELATASHRHVDEYLEPLGS